MIEYYSVDNAGNEESHHIQTHYVDNSYPELSFELGTPIYTNVTNANFTTSDTPIYLNATDMPDEITKLSPGVPMVWPFWNIGLSGTDYVISAHIQNFYSATVSVYNASYNLSTDYIPIDNLTWDKLASKTWTTEESHTIAAYSSVVLSSISINDSYSAVIVRYNVSVDGEIVARFIGEALLEWNATTGEPSIVGMLTNFDILNNLSIGVNNFELEIEGISLSNITEWFEGWGYPPVVTDDGTWVNITWESKDAIEPDNWEHFGFGFDGGVQQTDISAMRANWSTKCGVGSYIISYRVWNFATGWSEWYSGEANSSVVFTLSGMGDYYNCTHYIEYYAIDDLGNNYSEGLNKTVYVDNTPPESTVDVGEPSYYDLDLGKWYVTTNTPIWINTSENYSDSNACDSGCQYLHWEAEIWNGAEWQLCDVSVWNESSHEWENRSSGDETSNKLKFHFNEECHHRIIYYGVDNVSNKETTHIIEFNVDDTPPSYDVNYGNESFVRSDTDIKITPQDEGDCKVGKYIIRYNIWNETDGWQYDIGNPDVWPNSTSPVTINLEGECKHYVYIIISDVLGNIISDNLTYYVDNTPPSSSASPGDNSIVNSSTTIVLTASDPGGRECASDSSTIYYRIFSKETGEWSNWTATGSGTAARINFNENCTHYLEFYAVDSVGNEEELHNYTYYVDNTAPQTGIQIGEPNVSKSSTTYYITTHTHIWLNASDTGCPGGEGVKELHYSINGEETVIYDNQEGDWNDTTGVISANITIPEECNHTLVYWSIDNAGNVENEHTIYLLVDNTPPAINLTIGEPKYDKNGNIFINFTTPIWVNVSDAGATEECTVGSVNLSVRVYNITGETTYLYHNESISNGWINYSFTIDEECIHWINITAIDDLGNTAYYNYTVHVDNSPPVLEKEIGEPKHPATITETETILHEDFEGAFPPANWTVIENSEAGGIWKRNDDWGRNNYAGGYGYCADADSDNFGSATMDTELWTPVLDLSGYSSATLSFIAAYNDYSDSDYADVDISVDNGATWVNLLHWEENHSPYGPGENVTIDLTPYVGSSSVIIRWHYFGYYDWYWEIDNVTITGEKPLYYYITSHTPIYLNITDNGLTPECTVGSLHVKVGVWNEINQTWNYTWYNQTDSPMNLTIFMYEECKHYLNITMYDDLGNTAYDNETFYVDNSNPESHVETIVPNHQDAPITINVTALDFPECNASGVKNVTLYYRYTPYNNSWNDSDWEVYGMDTDGSDGWSWGFSAPYGPGYYQFYSIAYDNLGHKEMKNITPEAWVCVPYSDFEFHLVKGWNLITMPVKGRLNASMLATAIGEECKIIVRYDSITQRYVDYIVGINAPNNKDFDIIPGVGYFIGMDAAKDITIAEMRANVGDENLTGCLLENISIELHPGENLIGWANIVDSRANCVAEYFNNSYDFGENYTYITLTNWLSDSQMFGDGYAIGMPVGFESNFDISFGDGFFIYVPGDETVMWYGGDRLGEQGCGGGI